ncbi:YraN family protein [Verrucomicrobium sp. BvORR106]|uniref:YraN family protein n=1 Tax=Verrucomicrobium sp. BvORR106 TaxID=1403819 RepID=UPI00068AC93A|nr:YraN family protein [Verrucomicrobium sp. BvORR106]
MTTSKGQRVESRVIGDWGEHLAAKWLAKNGRKVLYRNFRGPKGGEVDIVCRHGEVLTFVEVKTRTSTDYGRPAAAVDSVKEKLILRGAQAWMRLLKEKESIKTRCDIVEVILSEGEKPKISVLEGAFRVAD